MDSNKYYISKPYLVDPTKVIFSTRYSQFNQLKTKEDYNALKMQIKNSGQTDPIFIRDGECDDGRHRVKIAEELGLEVLAVNIDPNIDEKEYIIHCNKNTFGSRNYSSTQLALKALQLVSEFKFTDTEAAAYAGLKDRRSVGYARAVSVSKYNINNRLIDALAKGESVSVDGEKFTKSIEVLKKMIVKQEELEMLGDTAKTEDLAIDYNLLIKTELGKELFWKLMEKDGAELKLSIIKLINTLYKDAELSGSE